MRVLLSGYYGFGNLGDEALLAAMVAGLHRHGYSVCVLSGNPDATRRMHRVAAVHRYRDLLPALLRSDVLVSGGGGLLQDATSARSLGYYLGVIGLARRLRRRALVYGQSIGPLSPKGRDRVTRVLDGVPIAVRDTPSMALLHDLGLDGALVADAALLLPPPGDATAPPATEPSAPALLIPRSGHDDLNDALAAAGRRLVDAGLAVAVLGLHEREDGPALERLSRALKVPRLRATEPAQAIAHIATARYVLSARLHGLIFAAVAGIGFAGLVYDPKVAGFLAEADAPAFSSPVDPHPLAELAMSAPPPAARAVQRLRQRAAEGLDWLANHIAG